MYDALINFHPCYSDALANSDRFRATHLSSIDEIQHEVQLVCSLEGIVEPDQEGVFDILQQHVAFGHDVFLLSGGSGWAKY